MKEYIFTGRVDCEDQQMSTPGCIVACCNLKSYAKKQQSVYFHTCRVRLSIHKLLILHTYVYRLR